MNSNTQFILFTMGVYVTFLWYEAASRTTTPAFESSIRFLQDKSDSDSPLYLPAAPKEVEVNLHRPPIDRRAPEPPASVQDHLEQHIIEEHALEEAHKESDMTLEERHEHQQKQIATVELKLHPRLEHGNRESSRLHSGRRGHNKAVQHNWSGYKGPLLEAKERNPDSDFYTKYVHNTIGKKLAYPMIKGFWTKVLDYYPNATNWFDGGAGTCGVMEAALKAGKHIHGIELSDVSKTTCKNLYQQGLVQSGPLNEIPFPDNSFDLVFSSEVLEHVPPHLAEKSVSELVRIAQREVFTTISLRPSALDRPGRPPKVHLTVRPREWWEALFEKTGCFRNEDAYRKFQQYDKKGKPISPHFFIYTCDKSATR